MANTCRHGRPSTITCDFCRAESRGNDIRASGRETPPRWRVPKPQQIGAPVCRDCKPFVVFSAWGDLYAHLQGHIDAANGGPSIPTFKPDEPDIDDRNRSVGQLKPKITDADKAKLQALLNTAPQPAPTPQVSVPRQPIAPRRPVIVSPVNVVEPAHLITPHVFAPPRAPLTLCRQCIRAQGNAVHVESHAVKSTPMPDRIIKACLMIGGAIALFGITFSVLILFEVPASYYMPWYW
jgi:hypothetical protein